MMLITVEPERAGGEYDYVISYTSFYSSLIYLHLLTLNASGLGAFIFSIFTRAYAHAGLGSQLGSIDGMHVNVHQARRT